MLFVVLVAAMSQAPLKLAVVKSPSLGVTPARADELTRAFMGLLNREQMEGVEAKTVCENSACVIGSGVENRTPAAVTVALAAVGKDVVMDLECIQTSDGRSLAQTTFTVKGGGSELPAEAKTFLASVRAQLAAKVTDRPLSTSASGTLLPTPSTPEVAAVNPRSSTTAPAIGLGVAGLAVGIGALVVMGLAISDNGQVNAVSTGNLALHTRREAEQLRDSANLKYTVALSAGLGSAALLVISALLFAL